MIGALALVIAVFSAASGCFATGSTVIAKGQTPKLNILETKISANATRSRRRLRTATPPDRGITYGRDDVDHIAAGCCERR